MLSLHPNRLVEVVGVVFPDAAAPGIEFDMPVDLSQRVDQGQGRSEVIAVVEVDMGDGGGGRQEFSRSASASRPNSAKSSALVASRSVSVGWKRLMHDARGHAVQQGLNRGAKVFRWPAVAAVA
jgi:hypothetical protein